jgi:hypothetical protein
VDDFCVVTDHQNMISYVDYLQKKNAEALSFYPKQVFEREMQNKRIFLGLLNGFPCGYLYVGAIGRDVKCHQVCIEYGARKNWYGASLVLVMEEYAKNGKATSITLRCGFDLDANKFWQSLGYKCIAHQKGGARRMRTINVWRKWIGIELFETPTILPAVGKTDSKIWGKNKKIGQVSKFSRGQKLNFYRDFVVGESVSIVRNPTMPQPETNLPISGLGGYDQVLRDEFEDGKK